MLTCVFQLSVFYNSNYSINTITTPRSAVFSGNIYYNMLVHKTDTECIASDDMNGTI